MNTDLTNNDIFIDNTFTMEKFKNPHSFFWPGYFWMWNDKLSMEYISTRLKEMNDVGSKSVWALPVPGNFRPGSMPTSLEPEYLSDDYMKIYSKYIEEAAKLGMKIWLYDDGGWPSGSICGKIVAENPGFAAQSITCCQTRLELGQTFAASSECLAAFLFEKGKPVRRLKQGETVAADKSADLHVEEYFIKRENTASLYTPAYPDLLNPLAVEKFVEHSLEVYKKGISKYFGTVVPIIFTDEPRVSNPAWTDDMAGSFEKKYGYSLIENLPAIFNTDDDEGAEVRIHYYDWWSERFSESFLGRIQDWSHKNSLLFAGHFGGDEYTLASRVHGYGHILRALRKLDIPGVDTIWRQIYPGSKEIIDIKINKNQIQKLTVNQNHHFPKYASTIAHQKGLRWALTESFGIYGSGLTLEQMKWVTNFQYVRGINLMTVSCTHLTVKEYFMARERPMFIKENPQWEYMELFHSYTARLSYVLSLGSPAIDAAVYFPIRDIWAGGVESEKAAESNDLLVRVLLENQCDFDFVDDDVLESESTSVENGYLVIGAMKYHTIYVSRTRWMSGGSKKRLEEFSSNGGRLIFSDCEKQAGIPTGSIFTGIHQLGQFIDRLIAVEPQNSMIRVCRRQLEKGRIYFIVNEDLNETECILKFKESASAFEIDAETGECRSISKGFYSDGIWSIPVKLEFAGSRLFYFFDDKPAMGKIAADMDTPTTAGKYKLIEDNWFYRKVRTFKIGEHSFEINDNFQEDMIPVNPGDWRSYLGEDFSGTVEYNIKFNCSGAEAENAYNLDLGTVRYNCEVILNDINLGKRAWSPYVFRVAGSVKEGENVLKVFVTNTMANQYVNTHMFDKWPHSVLSSYHDFALAFEKDSLPSGLFGPVAIRYR
ncbi:MAG: hypothetical protein FIA99_10895 [Ruminiclostridium sp.]|nr:hypothetical protein [Ruminiclostridium sp.]